MRFWRDQPVTVFAKNAGAIATPTLGPNAAMALSNKDSGMRSVAKVARTFGSSEWLPQNTSLTKYYGDGNDSTYLDSPATVSGTPRLAACRGLKPEHNEIGPRRWGTCLRQLPRVAPCSARPARLPGQVRETRCHLRTGSCL